MVHRVGLPVLAYAKVLAQDLPLDTLLDVEGVQVVAMDAVPRVVPAALRRADLVVR